MKKLKQGDDEGIKFYQSVLHELKEEKKNKSKQQVTCVVSAAGWWNAITSLYLACLKQWGKTEN